MTGANAVRAYSYLAGVFQNQQRDPFCRACKAFVNSVNNVRESLASFNAGPEGNGLSVELQTLLSQAREVIDRLSLPEGTEGQKRAGKCLMPTGVCFVKHSLAILEKI